MSAPGLGCSTNLYYLALLDDVTVRALQRRDESECVMEGKIIEHTVVLVSTGSRIHKSAQSDMYLQVRVVSEC